MKPKPRDYAAAADWLGKSESWLRHQVAAGEVPYTKVGRDVRFTEEHLDQILAAGEHQPRARGVRAESAVEKMRSARKLRAA